MASGSCSFDDCGRSSLGADGFSLLGDEISDDNDGTVFDHVISSDGNVVMMVQSDESYNFGNVPTSIAQGTDPPEARLDPLIGVNSVDHQAFLSMPKDTSSGINDTGSLEASAESHLYQLICMDKEEQNKMIVSKLQTLREEFHRLCNDVSAGSSSENASKVDFGLLDADVGPVDALGIWGCRAGVARYLVQECGFPANFADERQMLTERPHTNDHSSLSEGLYLWRLPTTGTERSVKPGRFVLFVWPGKSTFLRPSRSSAYTSLLRYLLELCPVVVLPWDALEAKQFNPSLYPFGNQERGGFRAFKLNSSVDQETNIEVKGVGFELSLLVGPDCEPMSASAGRVPPHAQAGEQGQHDICVSTASSACCLITSKVLPPKRQTAPKSVTISADRLREDLSSYGLTHFICFQGDFWLQLLKRLEKGDPLERIPAAKFLQHLLGESCASSLLGDIAEEVRLDKAEKTDRQNELKEVLENRRDAQMHKLHALAASACATYGVSFLPEKGAAHQESSAPPSAPEPLKVGMEVDDTGRVDLSISNVCQDLEDRLGALCERVYVTCRCRKCGEHLNMGCEARQPCPAPCAPVAALGGASFVCRECLGDAQEVWRDASGACPLCKSAHMAHSQSACARSEAAGMLDAYRCTSNLTEFMKTNCLLNSMSPLRGRALGALGCLQQAFGLGDEFPHPVMFENVKVLLHRRAVGEVLFENHRDSLKDYYKNDYERLIRATGYSTKRDLKDIIEDCLDRVAFRMRRQTNWAKRLLQPWQSFDDSDTRRFHDDVHAGVLTWMESRAAEVQDECVKAAVESRIAELKRVHECELTQLSDRETEHMRQLTNDMLHDKGRVLAETACRAMGLPSRSETALPALEIKKMSVKQYFSRHPDRLEFVVDATEELFIPQGSMCTISNILPESRFPSEGVIDASPMAVGIAPQIRQHHLDANERLLLVHPVVMESGGGRRMVLVIADAKKRLSTVHVAGPADNQLGLRTNRKALHKSLSLAAFDDVSRLLVLYSAEDDRMQVNRFDANYSQIKTMWEIPLAHDLGAPLRAVSIVPGKGREILMVCEGRIYLYSAMNKMWRSSQLHLKSSSQEQQFLVTRNGAMVLVIGRSYQGSWTMQAYCLEPSAGRPPFHCIKDDFSLNAVFGDLSSKATFSICRVGNEDHLVACDPDFQVVESVQVGITSLAQTNQLQMVMGGVELDGESGARKGASEANAQLDYLHYTFEKFPACSPLGPDLRPTVISVMINGDATRGLPCQVEGYIERLWRDIRRSTKKPFSGSELAWHVTNTWHNVAPLSSAVESHTFGDWMQVAASLVPLQICRCEGNILCPMSDGKLLDVGGSADAEETLDIDNVARSINFGMYDAILEHCEVPVVVVSSMGAQSVGKSYQLNHLGGCFFDVSGGRCTDGAWMTMRRTRNPRTGQDCLVVFLDFEGIGSWERTETEDMLMSLFSAAISNITVFKTHFDFNRYTEQTLSRFNTGAPKVKAMCGADAKGVFQGVLIFALKDTQHEAVADIMKEFSGKLQGLVQSDENFISALYNGGVTLADFPFHLDEDFYKQLQKLSEQVFMHKPQLSKGTQCVELLQTLIAKISHKDWTPIDRNQIRNRVQLLGSCLYAACQFGCTGLLETGERPEHGENDLIDVETQEPIMMDEALEVRLHLSQVLVEAAIAAIEAHQELQDAATRKLSLESLELCDDEMPTRMEEDNNIAENGNTEDGEQQANVESETRSFVARFRMPDTGLSLRIADEANNGDLCAADTMATLKGLFCQAMPHGVSPEGNPLLHKNFESFLRGLVARRRGRVNAWLNCNMKYFLEDPEAKRLHREANKLLQNLELQFMVCQQKCDKCFCTCFLPRSHTGNHDCSGSHRCEAACHYCELLRISTSSADHATEDGQANDHGHNEQVVAFDAGLDAASAVCADPAGHPGRHHCGSSSHVCGEACHLFAKALNCAKRCVKLPGHDGRHECSSGNHLCGELCSLDGCDGLCVIPYGQEHERHECARRECPMRCALCSLQCCHGDHFHAEDDAATHLCGRPHQCANADTHQPNLCSCDGTCEIKAELRREQRTFHGQRGEFEYSFRTQQIVHRHNCVVEIPPGELSHDGRCLHSEDPNVVHYCGEKCPNCGYCCILPFGHEGVHDTNHGNMINTYFVSDEADIDVEDRKYVRGESGVAETCDGFCVASGRGHMHVVRCDRSKCESDLHEGHRHVHENIYTDGSPDGEALPKDELTHEAYWEHICFKDPCTEAQKAVFGLCGAQCGSIAHDEDMDQETGHPRIPHCQLPVWHEPCAPGATPDGFQGGYISPKGHYFPCVHSSSGEFGCYSTYLIIDRSGSMGSHDVHPSSPDVVRSPGYCSSLECRLGVVYEAAFMYMSMREARSPTDLVSFIPFNDSAQSVFTERPVHDKQNLLASMMRHHPNGGTTFRNALDKAHSQLSADRMAITQGSANSVRRKPIWIFLTDSGDHYKAETVARLQSIMDSERNQAMPLSLHTIGFGTDVDEGFLKQMANMGEGSFTMCRGEADIGGMQLVRAFEMLAERPDRKTALMT